MLLRWSPAASDDFEAIVDYFFENSAASAEGLVQNIQTSIEKLLIFPGLGRPGQKKGTRELIVNPFIVVYEARDDVVHIIRIVHGRQDWRA
jgi:toxin ParE1/3/4